MAAVNIVHLLSFLLCVNMLKSVGIPSVFASNFCSQHRQNALTVPVIVSGIAEKMKIWPCACLEEWRHLPSILRFFFPHSPATGIFHEQEIFQKTKQLRLLKLNEVSQKMHIPLGNKKAILLLASRKLIRHTLKCVLIRLLQGQGSNYFWKSDFRMSIPIKRLAFTRTWHWMYLTWGGGVLWSISFTTSELDLRFLFHKRWYFLLASDILQQLKTSLLVEIPIWDLGALPFPCYLQKF